MTDPAPTDTVILDVDIAGLGGLGDGLADGPEGRLYVALALPGERVRVRVGQRRGEGHVAEVVETLVAAAQRREPPCPHFGRCGGCVAQHFGAALYAGWKRDLVASALRRRGFAEPPVEATVSTPPFSRRRARFHAVRTAQGVVLGFHERGSNAVVDLAACPVLVQPIVRLLAPLRAELAALWPVRATGEVEITLAENGLDVLIRGDRPLDLAARERLAAFAATCSLARLTYDAGGGPELVAMQQAPSLNLGGMTLALPPGAFLQPSHQGQGALFTEVARALGPASPVADLFAGVGTFSLPLALTRAVRAFDVDDAAIAAMQAAARQRPGLRLVAQQRDLFRRPLSAEELKPFRAVVFDPPRQGARAQAEALAASSVPLVIAVSCDPGTFARDARILADGGYTLERVVPVDQFLWSAEVEVVAVFRRG